MGNKEHWEQVYTSKQPHEVSWTQDVPSTSLSFIEELNLPKNASIIDIGGGDSRLADFLLAAGYTDITVLDISAHALDRAKKRLGALAEKVTWVVSDITEFNPVKQYDLWHDRATFHFLTSPPQIEKYVDTARRAVKGFLTIGTFSLNGPLKCSGLDIHQYDAPGLQQQFAAGFTPLECITEDHVTPFQTKQNFLFCSFQATAPAQLAE